MLISHKDCGGYLVGDMSKSVKLLVDYAFTRKGLKVVATEMMFLNDSSSGLVFDTFYCQKCHKNVEAEEAIIQCNHCGLDVPLPEALLPTRGGGLYCKEHGEKLFKDEGVTLVGKLLKSVYISK
jgi:hypothetical protein